MKKGHEVVVLEASGRHGGHVYTTRDELSDGLYGDFGQEHIVKPGCERYWELPEGIQHYGPALGQKFKTQNIGASNGQFLIVIIQGIYNGSCKVRTLNRVEFLIARSKQKHTTRFGDL